MAEPLQDQLRTIRADAVQEVVWLEDIDTLIGTLTVQVRVKDVYGHPTVYPANLPAIRFAEIAGTKTLTPATIRGIRALGFAVEVLTGTLPPGF